jgi:hypothetical protein
MTGRDPVPYTDPRVTRHSTWTGEVAEGKTISLSTGDQVRANVPGRKSAKLFRFSAYIVPDRGAPYVEVIDGEGLARVIRPTQVLSKKRKRTP